MPCFAFKFNMSYISSWVCRFLACNGTRCRGSALAGVEWGCGRGRMELLTSEEQVDSPRRDAPALISIRPEFSIIEVARVGSVPRRDSARWEACNDRQDWHEGRVQKAATAPYNR